MSFCFSASSFISCNTLRANLNVLLFIFTSTISVFCSTFGVVFFTLNYKAFPSAVFLFAHANFIASIIDGIGFTRLVSKDEN